MADNFYVDQSSGSAKAPVATDEIGGVHYQLVKLAFGPTDTATLVTGSVGFPANILNTSLAVTAASLPLPSGAATEASLSAIAATVAGVVNVRPASPTAADYLPVRLTDGSAFYSASGGGGGGGAVTQSGTWTVQPGNTANTTAWLVTGTGGTFPVTGTFWQATQPVSLASVPSHAVTNAGTFAVQATQAGTWTVTGAGGSFPVTDSGGTLTVDAPVGTPVFVRLSDGTSAITTLPVSLASAPLPTGAASESTLSTASGSLLTISGKLPASLGAKAGNASLSIVPASDATFVIAAGTNLIGSVASKHGTKAFTTAAPTTTAASVLAANSSRIRATIANAGSQTVYLGGSSGMTTANGIPLAAGASMEDGESTDAWWAITASGTGDLRIVEVS